MSGRRSLLLALILAVSATSLFLVVIVATFLPVFGSMALAVAELSLVAFIVVLLSLATPVVDYLIGLALASDSRSPAVRAVGLVLMLEALRRLLNR